MCSVCLMCPMCGLRHCARVPWYWCISAPCGVFMMFWRVSTGGLGRSPGNPSAFSSINMIVMKENGGLGRWPPLQLKYHLGKNHLCTIFVEITIRTCRAVCKWSFSWGRGLPPPDPRRFFSFKKMMFTLENRTGVLGAHPVPTPSPLQPKKNPRRDNAYLGKCAWRRTPAAAQEAL